MAIKADDIRFFYSGGAANSLASASLGGIKSSVRVASQTATPVAASITGVTVTSATNHTPGSGSLSYNPSTQFLAWVPPGSLYEYRTLLTANGAYTVGGSDGTLTVDVVFASLPVIYKIDVYVIANAIEAVFPNVSAAMSLVGAIEYRCLYIKNHNASTTANSLALYISKQTTGPDSIYIGLDPAGVGNGSTTGVATTIVSGDVAPAGVTFTAPLSSDTGILIATVAPNQCFAFWEKRVVLPGSLGYLDMNTSRIGVALVS